MQKENTQNTMNKQKKTRLKEIKLFIIDIKKQSNSTNKRF